MCKLIIIGGVKNEETRPRVITVKRTTDEWIEIVQADTTRNAKLVTDWQQAPIFIWESFRAISRFLVRLHKKIRLPSWILATNLDFFTLK